METREWIGKVDRAQWGKGEWDNEPQDRLQWQDLETGFPCLAVRNLLGAWCGYVGISKGHPLFAKNYSACLRGCDSEERWETDCYSEHESPESILRVHGGITYSDFCRGRICHVVEGEDKVWWFGFDTAHADDVVPRIHGQFPRFSTDSSYKTLEYVKVEVVRLAKQLKEYKP